MKTFFRVGKGMTLVRVFARPNHDGYDACVVSNIQRHSADSISLTLTESYGDTIEEAVDNATGA